MDYVSGNIDGKAVLKISTDEAGHIGIWRTLPHSVRTELDGLLKKYELRPRKK